MDYCDLEEFARGIYLLELLSSYQKAVRKEWLPKGFSLIGLDRGGPKRNSTEEAIRLAEGAEMCCGRPMYRHGAQQRPGRWRCKTCGRVINRAKLGPEELRLRLARPRDGSRFKASTICRKGGGR